MKNLFTCLAALTLAVAVVGCANSKQSPAAVNESVTDVNVAPVAPREPEMAYTAPVEAAPAPQAAQPVWAEPAPAVSETPAAAAPASTGGSSYTVKKGDTLFSIAKDNYGSGKEWQRIVAANPGLSPSTLKAGKTIVLP